MTDGCAGEIAKADGAKVDVCQAGDDLVDSRGPVPRALRHGVYAETLLPDEDVTQFETLRARSRRPARGRHRRRGRAPDLAQAESCEVSHAWNDELRQPHEQPRS